MEMVLYILIGLAIVAGVMAVAHWLHRKKVTELTGWAHQRGWEYTERNNDLLHLFSGAPFDHSSRSVRSRRAQHCLTGLYRGHQALVFEYKYTVRKISGGGSNRSSSSSTYRYQVVALRTPAHRPMLEVNREHFGHKLLALVGVHDLQLPNDRFNSTFRVRTDHDQFAHDVLNPEMMEWLLADSRATQTPVRFEGDHLLSWKRGRLKIDHVPAQLDYLVDVVERVPTWVWGQAPRS